MVADVSLPNDLPVPTLDRPAAFVCNRAHRGRVHISEAIASDIKRGVRVLTR